MLREIRTCDETGSEIPEDAPYYLRVQAVHTGATVPQGVVPPSGEFHLKDYDALIAWATRQRDAQAASVRAFRAAVDAASAQRRD